MASTYTIPWRAASATHAPHRAHTRYVNEHRATPAQGQQPSKDDENNEERVLREYEVGEQSVNHVWSV